jgi:hypothetical protein
VALLAGLAALVVVLLAAFGGRTGTTVGAGVPANASRLLPAGPPAPLIVATSDRLQLQLPVNAQNVTAIGYHAPGGDALPLSPIGHQKNEGLLSRTFHRIFGGGGSGIAYYRLGGGDGPWTGSLDVGALPGTNVYAPVDGTIVGLREYVLNGHAFGSLLEIQPSGAPSDVVVVTHIRADPSLTVGSTVASGTSKIGTVVDFSSVERLALGRYTQDAGNHVAIEVHPAATYALR